MVDWVSCNHQLLKAMFLFFVIYYTDFKLLGCMIMHLEHQFDKIDMSFINIDFLSYLLEDQSLLEIHTLKSSCWQGRYEICREREAALEIQEHFDFFWALPNNRQRYLLHVKTIKKRKYAYFKYNTNLHSTPRLLKLCSVLYL